MVNLSEVVPRVQGPCGPSAAKPHYGTDCVLFSEASRSASGDPAPGNNGET